MGSDGALELARRCQSYGVAHATGPDKIPALDHFGHKLRADWMTELFAGTLPEKTRPWLQAQMPAWPSRAEALATGFAHSYGVCETQEKVRLGNTKTINTGETITVPAGTVTVNNPLTLTNNGSLNVNNLTGTGNFINTATGTITVPTLTATSPSILSY